MALLRGIGRLWYERSMAIPCYYRQFSEQIGVMEQAPTTQKKKEKVSKPKRAPNQYNLFLKEVFQKHKAKGDKTTAVMQKVAAEWKTLSDEQKTPYAEQAAQLKKEYEQQLATNPVIKEKPPFNNVKKGVTGYQAFLKEKTQQLKQQFPMKPSAERKKELSAHWKSLTLVEKQEYKNKALQISVEIDNQKQNYIDILDYKIVDSSEAKKEEQNLNTQNDQEKPQIQMQQDDIQEAGQDYKIVDSFEAKKEEQNLNAQNDQEKTQVQMQQDEIQEAGENLNKQSFKNNTHEQETKNPENLKAKEIKIKVTSTDPSPPQKEVSVNNFEDSMEDLAVVVKTSLESKKDKKK